MWIWAAMIDLKAHVLHGKSFHVLTGPVVIPWCSPWPRSPRLASS